MPEAGVEEESEKENGGQGDQDPHCNGNGRCHAAVWTCGESTGIQFVQEVKNQPKTHFKHPLAIPWDEMEWIGALGARSSLMHSGGTASRLMLGV